MARPRKLKTGLEKIAEAVSQPEPDDVHAETAEQIGLVPDSPGPFDPHPGYVIQVTDKHSKRFAQVAIIHRADKAGLLCYQPRGAGKPDTFTVRASDVVAIGPAKLKYRKEL